MWANPTVWKSLGLQAYPTDCRSGCGFPEIVMTCIVVLHNGRHCTGPKQVDPCLRELTTALLERCSICYVGFPLHLLQGPHRNGRCLAPRFGSLSTTTFCLQLLVTKYNAQIQKATSSYEPDWKGCLQVPTETLMFSSKCFRGKCFEPQPTWRVCSS